MIQGIFYARFLPQEGTKIVAQSPSGCIVPAEGVHKPPLFDFDVLQEYIIPRKAFFNRYITVNDPEGKCCVLGFPVSIVNSKYDRNEFIFNFGLVVEAGLSVADQLPYERVVRRLAITFAEMEKQNEYLSGLDGPGGSSPVGAAGDEGPRRPIEALLEIVKEDLNNYGECMIPVDDANTINMKLFPHHPTPAEVRGWHVPVAKMRLADAVDDTWDLTLRKVIAHIDGVNDVRRIAYLADVSLELTRVALRHLLYYDTVLLLDLFLFGSCYAPRPAIHDFVANAGGVVDECAAYVCVLPATGPSAAVPPGSSSSAAASGLAAAAEAGIATLGVSGGGGGGGPSASGLPRIPSVSAMSTASGGGGGGGGATFVGSHRPPQHLHSHFHQQQHLLHSHPGTPPRVSNFLLVRLMASFCAGRTVMEWLKAHMDAGLDVLRFVDVRRLVQFGVIKGYLYRVHKYAVSKQYLAALATGQARPFDSDGLGGGGGGGGGSGGGGGGGGGAVFGPRGDPLQQYTDGRHCFDQIITEQNLSDAEIMERLKNLPLPQGDLNVFYR
ncbi:hypothetical protein RB593_003089 [Gaeumannomyces tritici]